LRFVPHGDPQIVGNARRGEVTDEHGSLARSAAASARKGELKKISLWSKAQDNRALSYSVASRFRARSGKSIRTSVAGLHHYRCRVRMIEPNGAAAE
jgi:hypothetical protein